MHDMDDKNRNILQDVDVASDEYLRKGQDLSSDDRKAEMRKIQKMLQQTKEFGDEKVSIASECYELVDKQIRNLDEDLAKMEAEMREKSQFLATETEDEENETEEDNELEDNGNEKTSSKGRGRKKKAGRKSTPTSNSKKRKRKNVGLKVSTPLQNEFNEETLGKLSLQELKNLDMDNMDMPIDPNEPKYCSCQHVSYGDMVGCDNPECVVEWYHFKCVDLTTKTKGEWFCPSCITLISSNKETKIP
jgi:hypothetical protein